MRQTLALLSVLSMMPCALHSQVRPGHPKPLPMVRAVDSMLGITQYRTDPVRLEGSIVGSPYAAMELARNEYPDSQVEYLMIVTVVDTTAGFYFARGASLLFDIDGDTVILSGPGAVFQGTWDEFGGRRPRVPALFLNRLAHIEIAPYRVAPAFLQILAEAKRVRVRLQGVPYFERRPVYLQRWFAKQNVDLLTRFVAQWVGPPQPTAPGLPLAFYVPSN